MSISKEEIALYDRQIRLWGMDAQKKIRAGTILILAECMSATLQELCKNLALSGLGTIHVLCLSDKVADSPLLYSDLTSDVLQINPQLHFSQCIQSDPLDAFNSQPHIDFLVLVGKISREMVVSLNEAARSRNICSTWTFSSGATCFLLNDFITFDIPSGPIQFPSFSEVFSRNTAKGHRHALIRAFADENNTEAADSNIPYRIAGAAIMGALVCQEIIKFYSHKDAPVTNFVALDASNLKNAAALL